MEEGAVETHAANRRGLWAARPQRDRRARRRPLNMAQVGALGATCAKQSSMPSAAAGRHWSAGAGRWRRCCVVFKYADIGAFEHAPLAAGHTTADHGDDHQHGAGRRIGRDQGGAAEVRATASLTTAAAG